MFGQRFASFGDGGQGAQHAEHRGDPDPAGDEDGGQLEQAVRELKGEEIEVTAALSERVSPGQAFIGFHFPGSPANRLTSQHSDETTNCPEYKVTAVRIRSLA